ncbi:hypothetical protein ACT20J_001137 [Campylobacter upsaliensis]
MKLSLKEFEKQTTSYNQMLTKLSNAWDTHQYEIFYKGIDEFLKAEKKLINLLSKQEKTKIFAKQLDMPLKTDGIQIYGAGIDYRAKKIGNTLIVSGKTPTTRAIEKERRLSELERERLHLAFAREHNIKGFLRDIHNESRENFFKELQYATRKHFKYSHQTYTNSNEFLYAENRILPSDTITQAKEKLKKEKETYKLLRERKRKWN